MDFHVSDTGRAIAAFKEQAFERVLLILYETWAQWAPEHYTRQEIDDVLYNALCDSVDMTSLLAEQLPVIVTNDFCASILAQLQTCLATFEQEENADWAGLCGLMPDFVLILQAWSAGCCLLVDKNVDLTNFPPLFSFELTQEGYLRLYASAAVPENQKNALATAFQALWQNNNNSNPSENDVTTARQQAEQLITEKQWSQAIWALERMMQGFPNTTREAFKRMGDIYLIIKEFNKAVDCYMKSMVLGEPKDNLRVPVRQAAKYLLEKCETKEERSRLEEWLNDW